MGRDERATWPIRKRGLRDAAAEDLSAETTPTERLRTMWPLACEAWRLAGRKLPEYTRANVPGRLFRGHPPDDPD